MTAAETEFLEALRDAIHAYHLEVTALGVKFEGCKADLAVVETHLYGIPGRNSTAPGLLGEVAILRRSRKAILVGLRGIWAVALVVFAAGLAALLRK